MITVSIVVPMYNSEMFIEDCLTSLLRSTMPDYEILVVDDGSTDSSKKKLFPFLQDSRIKLIESPRNQGVAAARNLGIKAAAGRYIAFCDSDDVWEPTKLERQLAAMQTEGAAVSHTSVYYAKLDAKTVVDAKAHVTLNDMKIRNWIANSSGVYDTQKVGQIHQCAKRHEDYEMWCDALKVGGFSTGVAEPLVTINRREGSVSGNKIKSLIWHMQAQRRIFGMSHAEIFLRMVQNVVSRSQFRVRR